MFPSREGKSADAVKGSQMGHPLLVRAVLGSAGLTACIALLSGAARAADNIESSPIVVSGMMPLAPPNIAGTVTLPVKPMRYLDDWERARRDDTDDPQMQALIAPARGLTREQQIS